jgi:hypothetical protein
MKYALKYLTKCGDLQFEQGTVVRGATLEEMREIWPKITMNSTSNRVGVWFPTKTHPTIVQRDQLVQIDYEE